MYFPEKFISTMIIAALAFIAVGAIILIVLLIHDIRNKKLW
jgi:preprotein translocase subunit Sss1